MPLEFIQLFASVINVSGKQLLMQALSVAVSHGSNIITNHPHTIF